MHWPPLINSFAGWLSAIGTLLAVMVSLHLARRDSRIRLKTRVGLRKIFTTGPAPPEGRDFIIIAVTNVGRRVTTVTGLLWKNRLVRKVYAMQNPSRVPLSAQIPIRLQDGDEADFTVALMDFATNDPAAVVRMLPWPRSLTVRFRRVQVRTSTGEIFRARIEKGLRKWLLEYVEGKRRFFGSPEALKSGTAYDAAYLVLALQKGIPLATADNDLRNAARVAASRF